MLFQMTSILLDSYYVKVDITILKQYTQFQFTFGPWPNYLHFSVFVRIMDLWLI